MITYDLKLGYSCNNHCIHCVVETSKQKMLKNCTGSIDLSYGEIIDCMSSEEFVKANVIVITGGEPTVRKEFLRIIKFIRENYPDKDIAVQTNGRKLKPYIQELFELGKVTYAIAIHGNEEVHNSITGNLGGNPYRETWETIEEIKRVYGDFNRAARIEIVLSKHNLYHLIETIEFLYENGIKNIGVSYPHLDGFAYDISFEKAKEIGFSYKEMKSIIPEIYDFAYNHPDATLQFEAVPECMWRNEKDELLRTIPNIRRMGHNLQDNYVVKFPDRPVDTNSSEAIRNMHKQSSKCKDCILCCSCMGVWKEAIELFGDEGFTPIRESERR